MGQPSRSSCRSNRSSRISGSVLRVCRVLEAQRVGVPTRVLHRTPHWTWQAIGGKLEVREKKGPSWYDWRRVWTGDHDGCSSRIRAPLGLASRSPFPPLSGDVPSLPVDALQEVSKIFRIFVIFPFFPKRFRCLPCPLCCGGGSSRDVLFCLWPPLEALRIFGETGHFGGKGCLSSQGEFRGSFCWVQEATLYLGDQ